jgi:hypothetical protein
MNEQIKKLANIWANRRDEDEKSGITYTFSEKALEVFVEKIVNECAERVAHNEHINWLTAANAAKDIKHQFGVKE